MRKDNKGITLIEMIVVVAIMGVMLAAFGYSFSLISHRRVSNNALAIKQSIQITQTYNKSQGNTDDVASAANMQRAFEGNVQQSIIASNRRAAGLCKLKLVGPKGDDPCPYLYIYIADSASDLEDDSKCRIADGSKGKVKLEKKTQITVTYKLPASNTTYDVKLEKGVWCDIRTSRTTGGFIASKCSTRSDQGIPCKITITDGEKTSVLNLAEFTGIVTKK